MKKLHLLIACLVVFGLVLVGLGACAEPAPTSAVKPTPSATSKPTSIPSPTPLPTSKATSAPSLTTSPTSKPTPTLAPASFDGKVITVVVPSGAGGGTDALGRLYARHFGRFLPGKPTVIVRNIPGGENSIGANHVYFSKPDGLTILSTGSGLATGVLLKMPAIKFASLSDMAVVAAAPPVGDVFYFAAGIFPFDKPEDIMKAKGLIYGDSTFQSGLPFFLIREFIGFPMEIQVTAYAGGGDVARAFLSGEINCQTSNSMLWETIRSDYEKGRFKILCQNGMLDASGRFGRHPAFPSNILTADELCEKIHGKSPSGPAYEAFKSLMASTKTMGKVFLVPPGTPDNIVKAYWTAVEKMIEDPQFIKEATPLTGALKWKTGDETEKFFKKNFGIKSEVLNWLRDWAKTKYNAAL